MKADGRAVGQPQAHRACGHERLREHTVLIRLAETGLAGGRQLVGLSLERMAPLVQQPNLQEIEGRRDDLRGQRDQPRDLKDPCAYARRRQLLCWRRASSFARRDTLHASPGTTSPAAASTARNSSPPTCIADDVGLGKTIEAGLILRRDARDRDALSRRGRSARTALEHAPGAASGPGGGAAGTSSDASPLHRGVVDRYSPARSATDGQRSYS